MDKEQAISVLIQTALIAQKSGALNLGDAVVVKQAIDLLQPTPSKVKDKKDA